MPDYTKPVPLNDFHKKGLRFAPAFSRLLATLLDYVLALIAIFLLYMGASAIACNSSAGKEAEKGYTQYYLQTHLYYENENGELDLIKYDNYKGYENGVYLYYTVFLAEKCPVPEKGKYNTYWYNVFIYGQEDTKGLYKEEELSTRANLIINDGPTLFKYKEEGGVKLVDEFCILNDGKTDAEARQYYDNLDESGTRTGTYSIYAVAVTDFVSKDWFLDKYNVYADICYFWPMFICAALIAPIFKLVIPMIDKKRRTLGKRIIKIGVYNMDGKPLERWKMVIRFVIPYIFLLGLFAFTNFVLGGELLFFIFFILIWLISYFVLFIGENHRAIHDLFVRSYVIDLQTSNFEEKPEIVTIKQDDVTQVLDESTFNKE